MGSEVPTQLCAKLEKGTGYSESQYLFCIYNYVLPFTVGNANILWAASVDYISIEQCPMFLSVSNVFIQCFCHYKISNA